MLSKKKRFFLDFRIRWFGRRNVELSGVLEKGKKLFIGKEKVTIEIYLMMMMMMMMMMVFICMCVFLILSSS